MTPAGAATNPEQPRTFAVGDSVYLKGARFGLPGTVLRIERSRAVIYWRDMDHISRHRPITLIHAEPTKERNPNNE
jgi:hypothetical protein